jgi:hypothetical protein
LELLEAAGKGGLRSDEFAEGPNPTGEPWEEDAVYDLFPRLAAKYEC